MSLSLGDIQQVEQPIFKFWTKLIQNQSNQYFKIFLFTPIPTIPFNDLDFAMAAISNDLTVTIKAQCRKWHDVKVWPILVLRYESANALDETFKTFNAYQPVSHSIFLYNQPELYADRTNPYFDGLNRIADRLLEENAKFIRGKARLVLEEIYFLNLIVVQFAPLSG